MEFSKAYVNKNLSSPGFSLDAIIDSCFIYFCLPRDRVALMVVSWRHSIVYAPRASFLSLSYWAFPQFFSCPCLSKKLLTVVTGTWMYVGFVWILYIFALAKINTIILSLSFYSTFYLPCCDVIQFIYHKIHLFPLFCWISFSLFVYNCTTITTKWF